MVTGGVEMEIKMGQLSNGCLEIDRQKGERERDLGLGVQRETEKGKILGVQSVREKQRDQEQGIIDRQSVQGLGVQVKGETNWGLGV